jgi:hypothetical protein
MGQRAERASIDDWKRAAMDKKGSKKNCLAFQSPGQVMSNHPVILYTFMELFLEDFTLWRNLTMDS